ncbi:MAG: hypothetical protein ABJE66_21315 [Deltaproteobacteria bacterium]
MPKPFFPKPVRLLVFQERLNTAQPLSNGTDAKRLIDETLNAVEDELTDIPYDPNNWRTDGRMYPVQEDNADSLDGYPGVTSYRSRKHETFVRENGAFEIRDLITGEIFVSKAGSDGKGVWS